MVFDHRDAVIDGITGVVATVDRPARPAAPATPQPVRSASTIVRLSARPELDEPARAVTRWWLEDPRFGQVSVYVPVGKTPREALTIALAERGYQVLPAADR